MTNFFQTEQFFNVKFLLFIMAHMNKLNYTNLVQLNVFLTALRRSISIKDENSNSKGVQNSLHYQRGVSASPSLKPLHILFQSALRYVLVKVVYIYK